MNEPPEPLAGLILDHRRFEAATAAIRQRLALALTPPADATLVDSAFSELAAFLLLLEQDIERHIAKEERVLFPLLRSRLADLSGFIDDMLAEHADIKAQRERVRTVLAKLDNDHEAVRDMVAALHAGLRPGREQDGVATLTNVQAMLERLDWLFQGHFTGEEDGLFLPAEELLDAATLHELALQMEALDTPC